MYVMSKIETVISLVYNYTPLYNMLGNNTTLHYTSGFRRVDHCDVDKTVTPRKSAT